VPTRRDRKILAAVIGGCAALGIVGAVLLTREDDRPAAHAPVVAPEPATKIEMPVEAPAPIESDRVSDEAGSDELASDEDMIEIEPAQPGKPPHRKRRPKRAKTADKTDKPVPAAVGSGSATSRTPPNVEWDPTLLLPSDTKKP
jgi:hypothetical protein